MPNENQEYNPYAAPDSDLTHTTPTQEQDQYLIAFVNTNTSYYFRQWRRLITNNPKQYLSLSLVPQAGLNWAAFFLGFFWFMYRKMYLFGAMLIILTTIEAFAEDFLFIYVFGLEETPAGISFVLTMMVSLVTGLYANQVYLLHANRQIHKQQTNTNNHDDTLKNLSRSGGTSLLPPLLTLVVFVGFVFGIVMLEEFWPVGE